MPFQTCAQVQYTMYIIHGYNNSTTGGEIIVGFISKSLLAHKKQ